MSNRLVMIVMCWVVVLTIAAGVAANHTLAQNNAPPHVGSPTEPTVISNYLPFVSFQPAWQWQPAGLGGRTVRALLGVDAATYAGAEPGGIYRAADCSLGWQSSGLADQSVFALAQAANNRLYAGTFGAGVYRSTNSGQSWQPANSGLGDLRIYGLATHPTEPFVLAAGYEHGIYRTTNSGGSWQRSAPNDLNELNTALFDPDTPSIAYAGTYQRGLYKSASTGATFAPANTGLPAQSNVWTIAVIRAGGVTTVTIGTSNGIYRSGDGGGNWQAAGLSTQEVRALVYDPGDAAHWFAGTRTHGVWETIDGGATWRNISQGIPAGRAVYALRLLPAPCALIVAGTAGGVYQRSVWLRSN